MIFPNNTSNLKNIKASSKGSNELTNIYALTEQMTSSSHPNI
jgi:hypothetical protein